MSSLILFSGDRELENLQRLQRLLAEVRALSKRLEEAISAYEGHLKEVSEVSMERHCFHCAHPLQDHVSGLCLHTLECFCPGFATALKTEQEKRQGERWASPAYPSSPERWRPLREYGSKIGTANEDDTCCDRAGEYNGFGSGRTRFQCPKQCTCHD